MTSGWSLMASYSITWNRENLSSPGAAANPLRSSSTPLSPNDLINAGDDGRYHYALWNAKGHAVSSYLRPSSVIPPRIVRFGVKVDW